MKCSCCSSWLRQTNIYRHSKFPQSLSGYIRLRETNVDRDFAFKCLWLDFQAAFHWHKMLNIVYPRMSSFVLVSNDLVTSMHSILGISLYSQLHFILFRHYLLCFFLERFGRCAKSHATRFPCGWYFLVFVERDTFKPWPTLYSVIQPNLFSLISQPCFHAELDTVILLIFYPKYDSMLMKIRSLLVILMTLFDLLTVIFSIFK